MPRLFFYVQHLLGIGHIARASRIATALAADGWEVTVAIGGMPVAGFPGPGARAVTLPAVKAGAAGFADLVDAEGRPIDEAFKLRRRAQLLAAFEASAADVLVVEAFPFGRRQMRFELLPLLEAARARRPRPLVATSIRDILQASAKPRRAEETVETVERFFDTVLVHGDPRFARLEDSFPLASRIAARTVYTGLVAPPPPVAAVECFDVVVSAGGGAAGARMLLAAADALRLNRDRGGRWCFITGPNLDASAAAELKARIARSAEIHNFRTDFPALLASAKLSISQAGYNTICDLLRTQCRPLLVPFSEKGETEQSLRAQRLAAIGRAEVVAEETVDGQRLLEAMVRARALPLPPHGFDLEGAAGTARALRRVMAGTVRLSGR
jgi:predicted glycosyltransferase